TLPEYRFRYSIFPNKLTVQPTVGDARSSDLIRAKGRQPSLPSRSGELHRRWPLSKRPSSHLHQGRRRLLRRPISTVIIMENRPTRSSSSCPAPHGQIIPKAVFPKSQIQIFHGRTHLHGWPSRADAQTAPFEQPIDVG
ncbi:hypothetical protein ACLOJK_004757, partial [Asimina triloba]